MKDFFGISEIFDGEGNIVPTEEDDFIIKFFTDLDVLVSTRRGYSLLCDLIQTELNFLHEIATAAEEFYQPDLAGY